MSVEAERSAKSGLEVMSEVSLLANIWPRCRAVLGVRVCKWLRQHLLDSGGVIVLHKCKNVSSLEVARTLKKFPKHRAIITWDCDGLDLWWAGMSDVESASSAEVVELCATGHDSRNWSAEEAQHFGQMLAACKKLASLRLRSFQLGNHVIANVAMGIGEASELAKLDLTGSFIGAAGVSILEPAIARCRRLTALDLTKNGLGDAGAEAVGSVLAQVTTLRTLRLAHNSFQSGGASALATALARCWNLTKLDLGGNAAIAGAGWEELASALSQCTALTALDLTDCCPGGGSFGPAQGVAALGRLFFLSPGLEALDLGCMRLEAEGVAELADALGSCTALRHLALPLSNMCGDGARHLCPRLLQCTSMQHLDLGSNSIGADGALAPRGSSADVSQKAEHARCQR